MRDLKQECVDHSIKVARADAKAAEQTTIVQAMRDDDPRKRKAQQLLFEMQQNASTARINRAFASFDGSDERPDEV